MKNTPIAVESELSNILEKGTIVYTYQFRRNQNCRGIEAGQLRLFIYNPNEEKHLSFKCDPQISRNVSTSSLASTSEMLNEKNKNVAMSHTIYIKANLYCSWIFVYSSIKRWINPFYCFWSSCCCMFLLKPNKIALYSWEEIRAT